MLATAAALLEVCLGQLAELGVKTTGDGAPQEVPYALVAFSLFRLKIRRNRVPRLPNLAYKSLNFEDRVDVIFYVSL